MKLWWCMACEAKVGLGRHGQCEICESEAVTAISPNGELSRSVPEPNMDSDAASSRS